MPLLSGDQFFIDLILLFGLFEIIYMRIDELFTTWSITVFLRVIFFNVTILLSIFAVSPSLFFVGLLASETEYWYRPIDELLDISLLDFGRIVIYSWVQSVFLEALGYLFE